MVKTGGTLLVRVVDDTLTTYDVSGRRPRMLGSAPADRHHRARAAPGRRPGGRDRRRDPVPRRRRHDRPGARSRPGSRTFDVSDPSRPTQVDSRQYDGRLVTRAADRRRGPAGAGGILPPLCPSSTPDSTRTEAQALRAQPGGGPQLDDHRLAADRRPSAPARARSSDAPTWPSPKRRRARHPQRGRLPSRTTPDVADVTAVATSSDVAYVSPDRLVVATSATPAFGVLRAPSAPDVAPGIGPDVAAGRRPDPPLRLRPRRHVGHLRRLGCRRRPGRRRAGRWTSRTACSAWPSGRRTAARRTPSSCCVPSRAGSSRSAGSTGSGRASRSARCGGSATPR